MNKTITSDSIADHIRKSFNHKAITAPLSGPDGFKTNLYGVFEVDNDSGDWRQASQVSVKAGYVPHQVEHLIEHASVAQEVFGGLVNVNCSWHNGHRLIIQPTREYRREVAHSNDSVWPRVAIHASYTESYTASIGYYRDMCSNLSMMRSVSKASYKVRHTSSLNNNMDELTRIFTQLKSNWDAVHETMLKMQQKTVVMDDLIESVFGHVDKDEDSKRKVTNHEDRRKKILYRLGKEQEQLTNVVFSPVTNGWLAFNAVQGYIQHDMSRRGNPSKVARAWSAMNDVRVNHALDYVLAQ